MLAIILGMIFVAIGVFGVVAWWSAFLIVLKGLVPVMLACGGLLAVIAGITSIRDSMAPRTTEEREGEGNK